MQLLGVDGSSSSEDADGESEDEDSEEEGEEADMLIPVSQQGTAVLSHLSISRGTVDVCSKCAKWYFFIGFLNGAQCNLAKFELA